MATVAECEKAKGVAHLTNRSGCPLVADRYESDRAFEWLDKAVAYGDPGLSEIVLEPQFANIHKDPRWLPFLESIGKSPAQLDAIQFKVSLPQ